MARPIKDGIDYFPLDVTLDTKFELLEAQYGLKGFAVVVKILQMIYGDHGYYCEWDKEVMLLFAKKNNTNCNVVSEIVDCALKRGIFDDYMFKQYGILTSEGIQKRYAKAKKQGFSKIRQEYLLINVQTTRVNSDETRVNSDETQQNKVNKNKENKIKTKRPDVMFNEFFELYPKKYGRYAAERAWYEINIDDGLFDTIMKALKMFIAKTKLTSTQYLPSAGRWLSERMWEDVDTIGPDIDEGVIML